MRTLPASIRAIVLVLVCALTASACAASPTVTVTREPTAAELAAEAELDRTFVASPAYLARVKNRATRVDTVRFEVFTEIDSPFLTLGSRSQPVIIGSQSGNQSRIALDMGKLMGPAAGMAGLDRNALSMTMIVDGSYTYVNAPFLAEIAEETGLPTDDYGWVQNLALGWGRIDAARSDLFEEMGSGASASDMLELLDSVGDVLDGGADEVRGVPVQVAHAQVSIAQVLELSGQNLSEMGIRGREADALRELSANIAVFIDGEGMVRRLEYNMDLSGLTQVDPSLAEIDLSMWQRADFFDYGQEVEIAVPLSWIDITDDFDDLLDELN